MHSSNILFLSNLFSSDMLIIIFVALLLFGGEKLPEIARGLGKGIRDFKDASEGVKREINNQINSYEEKRTEEALNKQAETVQNQLSSGSDPSAENQPHVENTIPVNESYFNGSENTITENHTEAHAEPADDHHADVQHANEGAKTSESIKNS
jgi:sec-independent protein translocase protein TatA